MNYKSKPIYPMRDIVNPHDHDVLSGRGNYVNYHAGNEHFRALVRKHKVAYVACPKPKKGTFSRTIVDEIRYRDPPGRFLKQDNETKMWYDIGDKKALDKTRQALREGAPELMKDLVNSDDSSVDEPTQNHLHPEYRTQSQPQFSIDDNIYNNMGGLQQLQMPPPSVVTSTGSNTGYSSSDFPNAMRQNRIVPGLINFTSSSDTTLNQGARTQPLGGRDVEQIQKQMNEMFSSEQFEPTPINPNLLLKVQETTDNSSSQCKSQATGAGRGLERADSLTFDNLFLKDQGSTGKPVRMGGNSSNHLSAMSFSIGDMSDATNLSAVFEDSMRISDDTNKISSLYDYAKKRSLSPHGTGGVTTEKKAGFMSLSTNMDMSLQTFGQDESNVGAGSLGSSMLNMSFKSKD